MSLSISGLPCQMTSGSGVSSMSSSLLSGFCMGLASAAAIREPLVNNSFSCLEIAIVGLGISMSFQSFSDES